MTQLSEFLKNSNTQELSTRKISELAGKKGHFISNATVSRYLSGKHPHPPKREVLQAFSIVLNIPLNTLESLSGLPGSYAPFTLPQKADTLNEAERAAILQLIDVLVAKKNPIHGSMPLRTKTAPGQKPIVTEEQNIHPEHRGYALAAHQDPEARARMDFLDSLGEDSQEDVSADDY